MTETKAIHLDSKPIPAANAPRLYKVLIAFAFVAVTTFAAWIHFSGLSASDDYTGRLAILERIFDVSFVTLLGIAAFSAGRRIARLLRIEFSGVAEELSLSTLLGFGVLALLVLFLGLVGFLTPLFVFGSLTSTLAYCWREVPVLAAMIRKGIGNATSTRQGRLTVAAFCVLLLLLLLRAATPPHAVDEAIYHMSVPTQFLEHKRIFPVYDNFSGNMPFLIHMLYVVCLMAKSDIAARLLSLLIGVLTSLALYGFSLRFISRSTGLLALFGFFGAGMVIEVAVTSRNDLTLAGLLFAATYALMVFLKTRQRGWLYLGSMLAGFALSTKYSGAVWLALLAVMLLTESALRRRALVSGAKDVLIFAVISLAISSPWFIKNYIWFSNPVYPYSTGELAAYGPEGHRYFTAADQEKLRNHFQEAKIEIPDVSASIEAKLADAASLRVVRNPFKLWELFMEPDKFTLGGAEAHHEPNPLFVIAPLFLLFSRRRWLVWLALMSAAFFILVAWTSWIGRYQLPVYPPLTLLSAFTLDAIARRFKNRTTIAKLLPQIAVGIAVVSTLWVSSVQAYNGRYLRFIVGSISRSNFMSGAFYYPPLEYINKHLPPDSKILMIGAQMSYELRRPYLAEAGWDSIEWQRALIRNASMEDVHKDLKSRGITHVLYTPVLYWFVAETGRKGSGPSGTNMLTDYGSREMDAEVENAPMKGAPRDCESQMVNWLTFEQYKRRFLEVVYVHNDYQLLRLK